MPKIAEINCPDERGILLAMLWANRVEQGYAPHDIPALITALANHRRGCPFCRGTALSQLFGQQVVVLDVEQV